MQANLNDTSFAAAILTKAGFALAEAPNSEFHKADLRGAHFYRTDITGAHFKDVETDDSTKWPEDYPPPVEHEHYTAVGTAGRRCARSRLNRRRHRRHAGHGEQARAGQLDT